MSSFKSDAEIDHIAEGLICRSLPKSEWTHAAHFAAALWLLKRRGSHAVIDMPPLIRAYNEATGVANTESSGYHETITLASLRAAAACLASLPGGALHIVLDELLMSPLGRADWPFEYWSRAVIFSTAARISWVEPDLKPLLY